MLMIEQKEWHQEIPGGVKWEFELAGFALGKWGSNHTGTGIWSLGMEKKIKNQKWEWDLRIARKNKARKTCFIS